jgi:hypothetical protein
MLVLGLFLPVLQYLWITLDGVDLGRRLNLFLYPARECYRPRESSSQRLLRR